MEIRLILSALEKDGAFRVLSAKILEFLKSAEIYNDKC